MLLSAHVSGQSKQVWLHGKVVRQLDSMAIPLAQIASFKKVNLFAADSIGEFKVILDGDDRIKVVALGFESRTFYLDSMHIDADEKYLFPLSKTTYQIKQVDINSNKHYNSYMEKLSAMRSKQMEMDLMLPSHIKLGQKPDMPLDDLPTYRSNPGVLTAVFQPVNFLYYYTAKSEKQKRKMMKLLKFEKQRRMMTNEMLAKVSGLSGDELQKFVVYCNANIRFEKKDTELSIKFKVLDLYEEYRKI